MSIWRISTSSPENRRTPHLNNNKRRLNMARAEDDKKKEESQRENLNSRYFG